MKKPAQHLIAGVPRRHAKAEMTIGVDLGDVWSHYCTLNQDGEVIARGRFRTTPKATQKWFTDLPPTRVAKRTTKAKPRKEKTTTRPLTPVTC